MSESRGITFTREQVEAWVGHELTDAQVEELEEVLPNSSLPQSVEAVAHEALGFKEPDVERRPCGCPEDYHLADCPLRHPGSDPEPYDPYDG